MKLELEKMNYDACNDHLKMCLSALNSIKKEDVIASEDAKTYERNFFINLAYQYGKGKYKKCQTYISGELAKTLIVNEASKQSYRTIKKKEVEDDVLCFPDFLIHEELKKRDDGQYKGQHLILEAKTTRHLSYNDFAWDFLKLNLYIENLKYNTAVYLIMHKSKSTIQSHLNKYIATSNYVTTDVSKIKFIIWDDHESDFATYKLNQ